MKENKKYYLYPEGQAVEVIHEVYKEYYRIQNHEEYLERKDLKNGKVHYSNLDTNTTTAEEVIPDNSESIEDYIEKKIMLKKMYACLDLLSDEERWLIQELFFNDKSERELAAETGIPQKTINNRKLKILKKLKNLMKN